MKERPINLTAAEVRGVLDGTLTSFRRPMKAQPDFSQPWYPSPPIKRSLAYDGEAHFRRGVAADFAPWKPGDRLWVRESWMPGYDHQSVDQGDDKSVCEVFYRGSKDRNDCEFRPAPDDVAEEWSRTYSEDGDDDPRWRSPVSMPRWASRIDLEVVESQPEKDAAGVWGWVVSFRRATASPPTTPPS